MKDLFVLTADADMLVVFRAILSRPEALGIRPIEVEGHPNRDSGVSLDYDGNGCNRAPEECAGIVQQRLDSFTFTDRSKAVVIAPELEEWLWRHPPTIPNSGQVDPVPNPKERLRRAFGRKPLPRDFEQIALSADIDAWISSPGFRILKSTLQNWFPRT